MGLFVVIPRIKVFVCTLGVDSNKWSLLNLRRLPKLPSREEHKPGTIVVSKRQKSRSKVDWIRDLGWHQTPPFNHED